MSKISGSTKQTLVKILAGGLLLFSTEVYAQAGFNTVDGDAYLEAEQRRQLAQDCRDSRTRRDEAQKRTGEVCRKSGLGVDCQKKAMSCAETTGGESFNSMEAIGMALGLPAGSMSSLGNACPQLSGRDYFTEKEKIEKEIKDIERDLADLNDDKAEIQDAYNQDMIKMQEDLAKAQEDYKKLEQNLEDEERERLAAFNEAQNSARERMRQLGTEILDLRGQLVTLQRQRAIELNALSDSAGKRKCMTEVNKMRAEYEKTAKSSFSSTSHIAQAKRKRAELIDYYNICMNDFNQQRIALNEKNRTAQERLEKNIRDKQSSLDEVENSLNLASSQLEEMKQATLTKKANALQAVVDMGERMQKQMQAAYTKLQDNLNTIATKTTSLASSLNRANANLMSLGPAPSSRSGEYSVSEAASVIATETDTISRETAFLTEKCGEPTANRSRSTRGNSRSTGGTR